MAYPYPITAKIWITLADASGIESRHCDPSLDLYLSVQRPKLQLLVKMVCLPLLKWNLWIWLHSWTKFLTTKWRLQTEVHVWNHCWRQSRNFVYDEENKRDERNDTSRCVLLPALLGRGAHMMWHRSQREFRCHFAATQANFLTQSAI